MKVCVFLEKRPPMDREGFRQWWLQHARFSSQVPGLKSYRINFVNSTKAFGIDESLVRYDATAELQFGDAGTLAQGSDTQVARGALEDTDNACNRRIEFRCEEHIVLGGPYAERQGMLKMVVLLKRKPELISGEFREWLLRHVSMSKHIPGLKGYRVNFIQGVRGANYCAEEVQFDATAEHWYADVEAMERGFASDVGRRSVVDAEQHCAARVRFLTEEHIIVDA